MRTERPKYDEALAALEEAHKACFTNERLPVLGMSHGPFSGVNKALGIVDTLEREVQGLRKQVEQLQAVGEI